MRSDSQCLAPPRPSAQTVSVHYETTILPLIVKCKVFKCFVCFFSYLLHETFLIM